MLSSSFVFCSATSQAQESNEMNDEKVYKFVQKKAEPKQGMFKFLQAFTSQFNSLVIPPKFDEISFKLKFVIEKNTCMATCRN